MEGMEIEIVLTILVSILVVMISLITWLEGIGPRYIAFLLLTSPVSGYAILAYGIGWLLLHGWRNLYCAIVYNRTYIEEMERRDELVEKLSGEQNG